MCYSEEYPSMGCCSFATYVCIGSMCDMSNNILASNAKVEHTKHHLHYQMITQCKRYIMLLLLDTIMLV